MNSVQKLFVLFLQLLHGLKLLQNKKKNLNWIRCQLKKNKENLHKISVFVGFSLQIRMFDNTAQ